MEGLAQSMAQPQQPAQPGQQGQALGGQMPTVDEVVALLMQGVPPEELEAGGIPPELIMQAIQILEQQMAAQQQQGAPQQPQQAPQGAGGLAQQIVG